MTVKTYEQPTDISQKAEEEKKIIPISHYEKYGDTNSLTGCDTDVIFLQNLTHS